MIQVRANNKIYRNFKQVEVSMDMDNLCGSFSFVSSISKDNLYPLKINDYIEIDADGQQILNGYIDKLNIVYSHNSHDIRVGGYGIISDILKTAVNVIITPSDFKTTETSTTLTRYADFDEIESGGEDVYTTTTKEFQGAMTLEKIARILLDKNGMQKTKVINDAGDIKIFSANEIESANLGETIFDFLETLSRKRQVILNSDAFGNLVLTRGKGESSNHITNTLVNKINHNKNNVLSASLNINNEDRFWKYIVHSNLNPIKLNNKVGSIVNEMGDNIDDDIRKTRKFEMKAEENMNSASCKKRAKWENNIRKLRSFNYSATVQGHSVNNIPYNINTLVNVIDEFCKINETLLIKKVVFGYAIAGGSITNLLCVLKDAYTLDLQDLEVSDVTKVYTSDVNKSTEEAYKVMTYSPHRSDNLH